MRSRLQRHLIAKFLQATDQSFLNGLPLVLIKIVASQFLIRDVAIQHTIDHDQDGMPNSHQRFLCPRASLKAVGECAEIRVLGMRGRVCSLYQQMT